MLDNQRSIVYHNDESVLQQLPNIFTSASKCQYVTIVVATLGSAQQPVWVSGSISSVSLLHMEGVDVHIVMPSDVYWDNFTIMADNELDIRQVLPWLRPLVLCMRWLCEN